METVWSVFYCVCLFFSCATTQGAERISATEYQAKAAFLYQLAKFVEWPVATFLDADSPITIGIFGTDPFGSDLETVIGERTAKRRRFRIKRFSEPREAKGCQILFIPAGEERRWNEVLQEIAALSVLTVGETSRFVSAGGIIGLIPAKNRLSITVNLQSAERAHLILSSQLLGVSKVRETRQAGEKN